MKKYILLLILLMSTAKIHGEEITFTIHNKAKIDKKYIESLDEDIKLDLEWGVSPRHGTMKYNESAKTKVNLRLFKNNSHPTLLISINKNSITAMIFKLFSVDLNEDFRYKLNKDKPNITIKWDPRLQFDAKK